MRVLMYSRYFPPQYSGAAQQAISLAKHLRERGHHIEFATVKWAGLTAHEIFDGFPLHRVEMGGGKHSEFQLWWNLFKLVRKRKNDFDIFHSHGAYYTNAIVGPLAKLFGWRSVVKASLAKNDLLGLKASLAGRIHYLLLKTVHAYVAISRDLEDEFLHAGLPKDQVCYLPNGVDTNRFCPVRPEEKRALRAGLDLPLDRPLALSVGVFDRRKNLGWLVENWVRHDAFDTNAFLLVVGPQSREDQDGAFLCSIKRTAAKRPGILRLVDHVDEIEKLYQAADLFILPSKSEGMPNVVLEAMASGLPCVTTRVSGSGELIEEANTGFTFVADDVEGFRQAFLDAFNGNGKAMGNRSRAKVEKEFSLSIIAEKYERLYLKLLMDNG